MDYKPTNLWSRWVNVTGVRAELTLRHLVPPAGYRKHLPSGARAITLHDQDLDSVGTRLVRENPALLDYGVAVLSIVKTDSFTVQGRSYPGAYVDLVAVRARYDECTQTDSGSVGRMVRRSACEWPNACSPQAGNHRRHQS